MPPTIIVSSPSMRLPEVPLASQQAVEMADLLRQLIDVQREQLQLSRLAAMNADMAARSRKFLERWQQEFPGIAADCKAVLPAMERVYLKMVNELVERLNSGELDDFDSEFILGEFLDKYGMRLNQLNTIIGQLAPLAEAAPQPQPAQDPASEGPKGS